MFAVIAVLNTASYFSLIHRCESFEYEDFVRLNMDLWLRCCLYWFLILFTGAMQQYENELFDVFQLNHQNHLYYNYCSLFATKLSFNWLILSFVEYFFFLNTVDFIYLIFQPTKNIWLESIKQEYVELWPDELQHKL